MTTTENGHNICWRWSPLIQAVPGLEPPVSVGVICFYFTVQHQEEESLNFQDVKH